MRGVLDTNVLVSAGMKAGSMPATAVRAVETWDVLLKSTATEKQFFEVLARPYFAPLIAPDTRARLVRIVTGAEIIAIAGRVAECRDPTDDKFLELALNGRADVIVSGDADLLVLDPFRGIPILRPADFVRWVRR
jgi:putative PIN family toxin of toxin-antitoxin system